jgi:hypothetical protein
MSTRSTIALEFANGRVGQVYCHSDGYLSYNGKILMNHYTDPAKLEQLIKHGDVSFLGVDIGSKINFDDSAVYNDNNQAVQCRFYGRDRGESEIDATYFTDFEDYKENHVEQEYEYILRNDGNWYVKQYSGDYELLEEAYVEYLREQHFEDVAQDIIRY